jgi:hypothetical protein
MSPDDQVSYPFTSKARWTFRWLVVAGVLIFVTVNYMVGQMDRRAAAVFAGLALAVTLGAFEFTAAIHRRRGLAILRNGELAEGIVINRRILPMGPTHRLDIEYMLGDKRFQGSNVVPPEVYCRYQVGDKVEVRVLASYPNRCHLTGTHEV